MEKIIVFPPDFLWGTATSAYQVEGGIEESDWSKIYPAGQACDHYRFYEKDFDLMEELNQNAYRFSIEWSRIEPNAGRFDKTEIEHYRRLLKSLKARGIRTIITLHHFSTPLWLAKIGGFANEKSVFYFSRFAERIFKEYKDLVDFWVTINEPLIYATSIYTLINGALQSRKGEIFIPLSPLHLILSIISIPRIVRNQIASHKKIYEIFHRLANPEIGIRVGIAKNNSYFEPFNQNSFLDKTIVAICRYLWNECFLDNIKNHLDFIGLNYYFHYKMKFPFRIKNDNKTVSDMGWDILPEGIYHNLIELKKYRLPVYITENGLADASDKLRKKFIKDHLSWVSQAMTEGVDVRGYFHWSLMDNFEWDKGLNPRFGLIEIDYKTLKRKPRPSAYYYAEICRTNRLE